MWRKLKSAAEDICTQQSAMLISRRSRSTRRLSFYLMHKKLSTLYTLTRKTELCVHIRVHRHISMSLFNIKLDHQYITAFDDELYICEYCLVNEMSPQIHLDRVRTLSMLRHVDLQMCSTSSICQHDRGTIHRCRPASNTLISV